MPFGIHIHHHINIDKAFSRLIVRQLTDIRDQLVILAKKASEMERTIMVSIQDLQAKADEQLARITAETDLVLAVKLVVENQNASLAELKEQIADLLAGGSVSPADLQRLSDTLDQMQTLDTANAEIVAQAVAAGTPAEETS